MSYRHSSYRKLRRLARTFGTGQRMTRSETERMRAWAPGLPSRPKPESWGKPRVDR